MICVSNQKICLILSDNYIVIFQIMNTLSCQHCRYVNHVKYYVNQHYRVDNVEKPRIFVQKQKFSTVINNKLMVIRKKCPEPIRSGALIIL